MTRLASERRTRKVETDLAAPTVVSELVEPAGQPVALLITPVADEAYERTYLYLGGKKFWSRGPKSRVDVHQAAVEGIQFGSLLFLTSQVSALTEADVAKVLGMSPRTIHRQKDEPKRVMPPDLASKVWMFAETLSKATEVFGGREQAESWMMKPAMGLDGRRPIDMLQTVQGTEVVTDFLGRLEYGVYT